MNVKIIVWLAAILFISIHIGAAYITLQKFNGADNRRRRIMLYIDMALFVLFALMGVLFLFYDFW